MNLISLIAFNFLIFTSCVMDGKQDVKEFYYPIDELETPKVYHYVTDGNKKDHLYWVLTKKTENGKVFLNTDAYSKSDDGKLQKVETIKEEINEKGAFVKEYIDFQSNEDSVEIEIKTTVKDDCVFKWELENEDSMTFSFDVRIIGYQGYYKSITKTRKYFGESSEVNFANKEYKVIHFEDALKIEFYDNLNNKLDEYNFTQDSYYASGIGMYKYIRNLSDTKVSYTLVDILSLEEWEKLKTNSQ